jgi:hypothetical protein
MKKAKSPGTSTGKHRPRRAAWMSAVAAVLVVAVLGGILSSNHGGLLPEAAAAYEPDYTVKYSGETLSQDYLDDIRTFAANAGLALLDGSDTTAYSPTALYTALSMVAELAEGDHRWVVPSGRGENSGLQLYAPYPGGLDGSACGSSR